MRKVTFLIAALALPLAACGGETDEAAPSEAPAGQRLLLTENDTIDWQDVSAEITTVDQAQVLARIPGILTSLSVREGDMVRKGQVIGRIVDNQLGFQAEAWRAQAVQAEAELARIKFLYENGVYADARLEQAQAAASAARSQYNAAAAVAGQGALIAPASGRVLRADVPAGAPVATGMVIAEITAGPVILRLEMPESLAGKVHSGSQVMAEGLGDAPVTGRVIRLYPAVMAGQVRADADMPGIDSTLIGRRVAARVETGARKALLVPESYVTTRYGIDYVTVLGKNGGAAQVPVQTAATGEDGKVEILAGAKASDTLIGPGGQAAAQ